MATNKTYSVVGVSTYNSKTKIRFANDMMRIKILKKGGHTDIDLMPLDKEMTKPEIIHYLREIEWYKDNPVVQDAMDMVLYRNPQSTPSGDDTAKYNTEVETV